MQQRLKESSNKQISTVDRDARLLTKRGQTVAGYNVQIVVDSQHKLIVADDVVQEGNDTQLLTPMLEKAQKALGTDKLTGLGDSGYYNGTQLKACEDQNMTVYVAIPDRTKKTTRQKRFTHEQFNYNSDQDCYNCPQGEVLNRYGKPYRINDKNLNRYKSKVSVCNHCPLPEQCLTEKAKVKQIGRWEHEAVVERHQERMKQNPQKMRTS